MSRAIHPTSGYSVIEEKLNSLTHGLAVLPAVIGWILLMVLAAHRTDSLNVIACLVYGLSLVLLYLSSALYHTLRDMRAKKVFLVLDHCCIYLLIAGTYTPFALGPLRGAFGWTIFGIIWGLAALGILKECLHSRRGGLLSALIYLAMGWLCLVAIEPLYLNLPRSSFSLLLAGGVVYSLGVVFYLARRLRFHHAIWHLFVVAGSVCQYLAIVFVTLMWH